jgi:tetraacyldisaccharide 4'-kinase
MQDSFLWRLVRGEARGAAAAVVGGALSGLALCYEAGVRANFGLYRLGLLGQQRLPAPVFSVGNLTVGGTGKTSAALAIARALAARGLRPALLSRGYLGRGEGKGLLVSRGEGPLVSAEEAGDEAYLLARKLPGVCVLVGKDRRATGRRALSELGAEAVVLDDGFQYWKLKKDCEIVLVDALCPFGYGRLLPRGLLREPLSALGRASTIWITHSDLVEAASLSQLRGRLSRLAPGVPLEETIHLPLRFRPLAERSSSPAPPAKELAVAWRNSEQPLAGRKVVALSSIGNPLAFELTLARLGAEVLPARFPDHHPYREAELARLGGELAGRAELLATTEKDSVRLSGSRAAALALPAWVLEVELRPRGEESGVGDLIAPWVEKRR